MMSAPVLALLMAGVTSASRAPAPDACARLAALTLPQATITLAQVVPAGAFIAPKAAGEPASAPNAFTDLPAFCRVVATLAPSSDSAIRIEVWMPLTGWNGRFQGVGNGGWAGSIVYPSLAGALAAGYATANTDTGHEGAVATFAIGHPEKLVDSGWRAVHEMTVKAKAMVAAFYGEGPVYSYWNGCSTGGKQALNEAQRFPDDYDGILAGAPANFLTHHHAAVLWVARAVHDAPGSYIPPSKYPLIHQAMLAACDALDGVGDGLLEDPTRCHFDPQVLECKGTAEPTCLTAAQVNAARRIYSAPTNPRTKETIFPGLEPGSELGWAAHAGPEPAANAVDTWRSVVFENPAWDWRTLDFDRDVAHADAVAGPIVNATNPDLRPFFARGGKLLMYHGWSDPMIAPGNSVTYYTNVRSAVGATGGADESIRLFMIPGMAHCGGGEGTDLFDKMGAIRAWVEQKQAPERLLASRVRGRVVLRTRPLCPYPQIAQYTGTGSTDDAANFVCAAPAAAKENGSREW